MINKEIIKIALNTKNFGLTNKYSFKTSLKNSLCGDKIKLELTLRNSKINSMKYETESCIFCAASAGLLSVKIKNLPSHFKAFKILINKKNINRINCINLPFDAVLKALK